MVWHSFLLNPSLKEQADIDFYTYVAELKGQTLEWSLQVHEALIKKAKNVGLDFQLDKARITNSFDAHRVIQLAKKYELTNEVEERFFKAYFTEGALMSDHPTLIRLATEAGLCEKEVVQVLNSNEYAEDVQRDGDAAESLGARGVPFFVFNERYTASGAQNPEVLTRLLTKAYKTWQIDYPVPLETVNGSICTPQGKCD
ncbi:DSBA-like thioredoxin domain protein [compost metagenome]